MGQITPQENSKSKLCLPAQTDGSTILLALLPTVQQLSAESPYILFYSRATIADLGDGVRCSKKEARERGNHNFPMPIMMAVC